MAHMTTRRTFATFGIAAVLVAVAVGLAACGSSGSSTTTTSTNASATSPSGTGAGTSTTGGPAGGFAGRFKAVRECLQKNGVTLPKRTPGQRPQGGPGGFLGGGGGAAGTGGAGGAAGGPQLPSGMSRSQYESILKKCGGGTFPHTGTAGGHLQSPQFKQALTNFADCMRESGVNIPAPNTSGKGPIFDTKGIDTASTQFRDAEAKCRGNLTSAFRRPHGAPGGTAPSGGETSG